MPATNFTQKLKLGIYQGNDSISPLVTGNENMEKIDAFAQGVDNQFAITQNQVNTNTSNIQVNAEGISDLDGRVKVIEGKVPDYDANLVTVAGLAGEVDTLQTDMATAKTDIVNVTQEANTNTTNITAINVKLAEELPFPLAVETESGETKYGWKPTVTGDFTPFAPVPPFNLATQGEGEDKQYGYTNDAGEFVPFESGGGIEYQPIGRIDGTGTTGGAFGKWGSYSQWDAVRFICVVNTPTIVSGRLLKIFRGAEEIFSGEATYQSGVTGNIVVDTKVLASNAGVNKFLPTDAYTIDYGVNCSGFIMGGVYL